MRQHVAMDPENALPQAGAGVRPGPSWTGGTLVLVALGLVLLVGWAAKPWQWSLVDDPDYRLNLLRAQQEHGWLSGILERIDAAYDFDRSGGQFRPLLWVYSATFYLLGPGLAHALRLLLLLLAVGSVGLAVRQRLVGAIGPVPMWTITVWAISAVLSVRGLFDGLSFLSIMELPTVTLAAAAAVDRSAARKVLWLTLASLSKTPVVGGLFALAVVLYRCKRRGLAMTALGAGGVIVLWARDFALGGSYTAEYELTLEHATSALVGLGRQLALPTLVLACALLWARTWRPRFDSDALVLVSAGLGYVVLLLPWGSSSGYNLAAPAFLLVTGTALGITTTLRATWTTKTSTDDYQPASRATTALRHRFPLVVALLVAGVVTTIGVKAALDRDTTIRGVVDWASTLPEGDVVATNGIESAVRYGQLLALRHGSSSSQQFVYAQPGVAPPCAVRWVVAMHDQGPPELTASLALLRSLPLGDIYRVPDSGGQNPAC